MQPKAKTDLSILLVEDYELDSDSILAQLDAAGYSRAQIQVTRNSLDTRKFVEESLPDVIILDLQIPKDADTALPSKEEDIRQGLKFLRVLSRFPTPWIVYQVLACGVSFIDKYNYKDLLPWAIEQVQYGNVIISSTIRPILRKIFPLALRVGLDAEDVQIIHLILEGLPDRDIADRLNFSEEWVSGRLRKMFRNHGFHSREELASWFRDFVEPIIQFE
jgi:DNA-binding NarL/FixJ family response regulator